MIRKMKKLSLFVFHEDKEKTLKDLASLGLVHIEIANGVSSDNIENIASKKNEAIRAKSIINLALSEAKKLKKDTSNLKSENTSKKALEVIENILSISQATDKLKTEREILKKELSIISPFGNFSFDKIKELQEKTEYNILFYSSTIREFNDYDFSSLKDIFAYPIKEESGKVYFVVFKKKNTEENLTFDIVNMPSKSYDDIIKEISKIESEIENNDNEIIKSQVYINAIDKDIEKLAAIFPELKTIKALDNNAMKQAEKHWDGIAKPLHGLGMFEDMIVQIAGIQGNADVSIDKKAVVVMCADNGIVEEGVTQTGQEVTAVVSCNMADGISSVCRMADCVNAKVIPVNIGIAQDLPGSLIKTEDYKGLVNRKVMPGTKNFLKEPAMTKQQLIKAVKAGIEQVKCCKDDGYNILATGEMGIGNTTTSAALACILLDMNPGEVTGRGAGLSDEGLLKKTEVIRKAKEMYGIYKNDPLELLRCIGGLDVAGLTGVYIGGAVYRLPVVVDGVISAVAALIAVRLCPVVKDYILVSHQGKEPAIKALLAELDKKAVIHAELALGEGTGAVMLFPLLDMAMQVYKENTTFDDIQITAYEDYGKC